MNSTYLFLKKVICLKFVKIIETKITPFLNMYQNLNQESHQLHYDDISFKLKITMSINFLLYLYIFYFIYLCTIYQKHILYTYIIIYDKMHSKYTSEVTKYTVPMYQYAII